MKCFSNKTYEKFENSRNTACLQKNTEYFSKKNLEIFKNWSSMILRLPAYLDQYDNMMQTDKIIHEIFGIKI